MKLALSISKNINKLTKALLIANIAILTILGTALAITSLLPGTAISGLLLPWAAIFTPQVVMNTFYGLITNVVLNFASTIVYNRIFKANAAQQKNNPKQSQIQPKNWPKVYPPHHFNQQHNMKLGKNNRPGPNNNFVLSDEELARNLQKEFENECTNTPQAQKDAELARKLAEELNQPPVEVKITDSLAKSLGFKSIEDLNENQADILKRNELIKIRLKEDEAYAQKVASEWNQELAIPMYAQYVPQVAAPKPVAPPVVVNPQVVPAAANKPQIIAKEKPVQINQNPTQDKDNDYNYSSIEFKQEIDEFWEMFIPEYIKLRPELAKETAWGTNTAQQKNADWLIFMLRDLHYNRVKQLEIFYNADPNQFIPHIKPIDDLKEFPFIIDKKDLNFAFHVENYKHSLGESNRFGGKQNCRIKDAVTSMQTLFIAMMRWGIANNKLKEVLEKIHSGWCIEGVIRNTSDAVKRLDSDEFRMHELITFGLNEYAELVQKTLNQERNGAPPYKFNDFSDMCAQLQIGEIFNQALIDFLFEVIDPAKREKLAKTGQPIEDNFTKENIRQNLEFTFMLEFSDEQNPLPIADSILTNKAKELAAKYNKPKGFAFNFR